MNELEKAARQAEPEHWVITTKVGDIVGFRAPGLKKGDRVYRNPPQQQAERAVVISPPFELKFIISPKRMSWDGAVAWAADQGLRLATVDEMRGMKLQSDFYWSGTEYSQSYAWNFYAYNGNQDFDDKGFALFAVAVAHKQAIAYDNGQSITQADSGNPSY
jgi:hypothetical protein